VTGDPADDPELVSAVIALIVARRAAATAAEPPSLWRARAALIRAPLLPGPGAWRGSALPR
jgi:hypothetical protein